MRKGHNIITTMPWIYLELNGRQLRIDSEDALNIYSWRDWLKTPIWFKIKPSQWTDPKSGYQKYKFQMSGINYILSRVIYKAHNPEWDMTDNSKSNQIDHINVNSLDNRIENLRIVTQAQNLRNTSAKGYCWSTRDKLYRAEIMVDGKRRYLGGFHTKEEAREAYLNGRTLFGV